MSFEQLKVEELRQVAESFAVDLSDVKNKAEIIAVLAEEGVSYDMYKNFADSEKQETEEIPEPEDAPRKQPKNKSKESTVLLKMERRNPSYETYGYVFTSSHPFVAIPENIAQDIFDSETGFRMATPREVQEFYS
jgi:hypothetical protein